MNYMAVEDYAGNRFGSKGPLGRTKWKKFATI